MQDKLLLITAPENKKRYGHKVRIPEGKKWRGEGREKKGEIKELAHLAVGLARAAGRTAAGPRGEPMPHGRSQAPAQPPLLGESVCLSSAFNRLDVPTATPAQNL